MRRVTLSAAGFVLICFFLPWLQVSCLTLRDSASGYELAHHEKTSLWLVPLLMLLILLTGLVEVIWKRRPALFALISFVGGLLSAYLMYHEHIGGGQMAGIVLVQTTVWFWLGLLASLAVTVTALLFYFYVTESRPP